MKKETDNWFHLIPPNINLLKCDLGSDAQTFLWKQIEKAKIENKNANKYLAGNIKESLYLEDSNDYFFNNHLRYYCEKYVEDNSQAICFRNTFSNVKTTKLVLQEFWVNFSKQTEFNPLHNHGGALSFVIWMNIPTKSEEQHNLSISKNTTNPSSSDFMFTYTDILGDFQPLVFPMDPDVNGTMIVFPATLHHQVYPFFNNDGERISISGNIYFDTDILRDNSGEVEFTSRSLNDTSGRS